MCRQCENELRMGEVQSSTCWIPVLGSGLPARLDLPAVDWHGSRGGHAMLDGALQGTAVRGSQAICLPQQTISAHEYSERRAVRRGGKPLLSEKSAASSLDQRSWCMLLGSWCGPLDEAGSMASSQVHPGTQGESADSAQPQLHHRPSDLRCNPRKTVNSKW